MEQRAKRVVAREIIILFSLISTIAVVFACAYLYEENYILKYWKGGIEYQNFHAGNFTAKVGGLLTLIAYPIRIIFYSAKWAITTLKKPTLNH